MIQKVIKADQYQSLRIFTTVVTQKQNEKDGLNKVHQEHDNQQRWKSGKGSFGLELEAQHYSIQPLVHAILYFCFEPANFKLSSIDVTDSCLYISATNKYITTNN